METRGRLEPHTIRVHSFPHPTMDVLIFIALMEAVIFLTYLILFKAVTCVSPCTIIYIIFCFQIFFLLLRIFAKYVTSENKVYVIRKLLRLFLFCRITGSIL
jgi:hypothetical protein